MKEAHSFTMSNLMEEFRKRIRSLSETGDHEINSIQNENYALNREIKKLLNEKTIMENEVQKAMSKLYHLEAAVGVKQPILNFSNSNL